MKEVSLPSKNLTAPGPARMIEEIDSYLDDTSIGAYVVVTDRNQHINSLYALAEVENLSTNDFLESLALGELQRIVLLIRFPGRFPEQHLRGAARRWSNNLGMDHIRVLDTLLVGPTHWWSAMCTDPDCCPTVGRPRLQPRFPTLYRSERKRLWDAWQQLLNSHAQLADRTAEELAVLIDGLHDLRLRDSILAHAGQNPEMRGAWNTLIVDLLDNSNFSRNVALKTTHCALVYLQGNLKQARVIAEEALHLDGSYSLALLLHKGLVTKAPPGTLEAAFCNASIDVLIDDGLKTA